MLEYKPRTFYNYILCREDILGNMRQLGSESLETSLDTLDNFLTFIRACYYNGKGTGRRDLMHIKETINTIIGWQDKVVKSGGKIYTCMKALLESSGIIIITAFHDSNHYMSHNKEAALMDFIGLESLTNVYNGSRFGEFANFSNTKYKNYGMMVMYTLFKNYLNNGAMPFTLDDLCWKKDGARNDVNSEHQCRHDNFRCMGCNKTFQTKFYEQ